MRRILPHSAHFQGTPADREAARQLHLKPAFGGAIRTSFREPEVERFVSVPTLESLLGDKLTAFAPHTTGVPFHSPVAGVEQVQQVAKQLFDVGVLFELATDFDAVARSYNAVSAQESEYRGNRHSREDALDDTWQACLALTASKRRDLTLYPDASLLHDGLDRMQGHLTWPEFVRGREPRRTLAARAAVLAAHLRAGVPFDFAEDRYINSPEQIKALRPLTLNGTPLAWLDGVKAVNPEAYHYWYRAVRLSSPA